MLANYNIVIVTYHVQIHITYNVTKLKDFRHFNI